MDSWVVSVQPHLAKHHFAAKSLLRLPDCKTFVHCDSPVPFLHSSSPSFKKTKQVKMQKRCFRIVHLSFIKLRKCVFFCVFPFGKWKTWPISTTSKFSGKNAHVLNAYKAFTLLRFFFFFYTFLAHNVHCNFCAFSTVSMSKRSSISGHHAYDFWFSNNLYFWNILLFRASVYSLKPNVYIIFKNLEKSHRLLLYFLQLVLDLQFAMTFDLYFNSSANSHFWCFFQLLAVF